jgi:hypothetical protein
MESAPPKSVACPSMVLLYPVDPITGHERLFEARQELRSYIHPGVSEILIDMLGVHTATSDLLSFLILCDMECQRNEIRLQVKDVSPDLMKMLRFAGLNQVLALQPVE